MKKIKWTMAFLAVFSMFAGFGGSAQATPGAGFVLTTEHSVEFEDIDVNLVYNKGNVQNTLPPGSEPEELPWMSSQRTKGPSEVRTLDAEWQPGGTTGWHTHPGHVLIMVTEGTLTYYLGDDSTCTPHYYHAGEGFVDHGGDHAHVVRNETDSPAKVKAVIVMPVGTPLRIDRDENPSCPEIQ